MEQIQYHPIANIFPLIAAGPDFDRFVRDISQNGLKEDIWLYEERILDGRNRYRACTAADVEPRFRSYDGDDPVEFVVSLNLHRRHLDESQRAMVAAEIANLFNGGDRKTDQSANLQSDSVSRKQAADMLNVSERSVNTAKKVQKDAAPELVDQVKHGNVSVSAAAEVSSLPQEEQQHIVAKGEKEILEAARKIRADKTEKRRVERTEKINKIARGNADITSVDRKYPLVYADPPWRYDYAETDNRVIENQYPTMSVEEICALDVGGIVAADDCVLYLWATSPKLIEALKVVSAWGFEYRTCAVWNKQKIGMGYYFRQQHELLLVATRGSVPVPPPSSRIGSVFTYERGDHSAKPNECYEMIESMYPELDKIELFSRTPRDNWHAWGNQSNGT